MASTQITVENRTDIPIYALLTWAGGHIGGVVIQALQAPPRPGGTGHRRPESGSIPCEYVWYDLSILDDRDGKTRDMMGVVGGTTLVKKQARGNTSWIFQPPQPGEQGYQLVEH